MNGPDALLFQVPLKGDIEIGRINADKDIGFKLAKATREVGTDMQQTSQATKHLDNPHHRQLFHFVPGLAAFGLHTRPGNTDEARIGNTRSQCADETRTKNIAGGFSGDEGNR